MPGGTAGSTKVALIGGVDRASLPDSGTSTPLPARPDLRRGERRRGLDHAPPPEPRSCSSQHGAASRSHDGDCRRRLRDPERQPPLGDPAIHRNIEVYDAATGLWTVGPAQDELRTYHSTALLLPDGRVLSAGDDGYGGSTNDTAEVYEPPYLFKGPRPSISAAPSDVTYGDTFTVQASADARTAVLMAPAAVTHANDMSQRHVPLVVNVVAPGSLRIDAPAAPELAPPTYYMLFVLNDQGVPSVARFIRLKLAAR